MKKAMLYLVVSILTGFALLTLFLSTSVIFDLFDVRAKKGDYISVVIWSNIISSFLYLISVYGLLSKKKWTYKTLGLSTIISTIAFICFISYVQPINIHKDETIGTMVVRIALTLVFTLFAYLTINKKQQQ